MCYKKEKEKMSKAEGSMSSGKKTQDSTVSSQTSSSQLNPQNFHAVQLRDTDQRQNLNRNIEINQGGQRTLLDKKYQLIASIKDDTDTEVQFSQEGMRHITNDTLRQIAEGQNGILRSRDILSYLYSAAKKEEQNADSIVKSTVSNYTWHAHVKNYSLLNKLCDEMEKIFHDFQKEKICTEEMQIFIEKIILECNDIILDYAGADFLSEVMYLISNIRKYKAFSKEDQGKISEQFENSFVEISRRHKEMKEELIFCKNQENQQEKAVYMYGDDCKGFSWKYHQFFKKEESDKAEGNYDSSTGYSYHYFIWLTDQVSDLNGGVTVETCAGKGGQIRAVFSIRTSVPYTKNPDEIQKEKMKIKEIDIQTIKAGKDRVRNYEQQFNVNKLNLHFQAFKNYISKAPRNKKRKVLITKEYSKNVNFKEIFNIYQLASQQINDKEEKAFFDVRYQNDANFKKLIDAIKTCITKNCLDENKNFLFL